MIHNSQGKIWYGIHFYPGVAEYSQDNRTFRVFLNEDTIRSMGPSFAGRPVFVEHVDEVDDDIDELKKEADGWVLESFFNEADGKHWVKFLTVSDRADRAIAKGRRLSNCYRPLTYGQGGLWNGVSYQKQVLAGEYEHLAIVQSPRYEESVILTPEQFKTYNEKKLQDLKRFANAKKGSSVKINLFKRAKVENAADLLEMSLTLPKSGREVTVTQLINEADEAEAKKKEPQVALPAMLVKVGDKDMTVEQLANGYKAMCDEVEAAKKDDVKNDDDDDDGDGQSDEDEAVENEKDEDDEEKKAKEDEKKKNELEAKAKADAEKAKAKEKADKLRNANRAASDAAKAPKVTFSSDRVALGKARYGS